MFFPRILLIAVSMSSASASLLVVDPSGRADYATIQSAVDAAKPGDVVQIRGGVYHEHVHIAHGGEPERPITMEAAPNETVLINAGRKLVVDLKPAQDLPEVFMADVEEGVVTDEVGFWEMPSRLRMARVSSPLQTSQRLGSWYFDAPNRRLYLRSSGRAPADKLDFWIESADTPAVKITASHIRLRNLQATLGQHGFLLEGKNLSHVTIEGCRAFCNSWAGIQATGDHHVIRDNETFQNNTYGIQLRHGVNHVKIQRNLCLFNGPNNGASTGSSVPTDLGIYSQGGDNVFEENIVEGLHEDVYRNKTGHGQNATNILRNNVIKGHQTPGPFGVVDNTLLVSGLGMRAGMYRNGGSPSPLRDWKYVDPTGEQRARNLIHPLVQDKDPHFADAAYRDYRLQGDSPYPGSGAYPERAAVFYVNPENGSDDNDGRSIRSAFATSQAALQRLEAGATLYLLPGNYASPIVIKNGGKDAENPLRIRAYGKQAGVKISGGMTVEKGRFVEIDGLEFLSRLELNAAQNATVRHCVFDGKTAGITATASPQLQVDRCTFSGNETALRFSKSPDANVIQNLFVNCAIAHEQDAGGGFFDFNAYTNFAAIIAGKPVSDLKTQPHSMQEAIALLPGHILPSGSPLAMRGVDFGHLGARVENETAQLGIANLQAAGLSPHGATLLWDTPRKASLAEITLKNEAGEIIRTWEPSFFIQIMGTSYDVTNFSKAFFSSQRHAVVADLQPDTAYTATVVAKDLEGNRGEAVEVAFRTPRDYKAPAVWYISPKGNDAADGKSPATAWGSFSHALAQAGPGDEVILLPGKYREILRPRVSGTAQRQITIRAEKPQTAIIDLAKSLPVGVEMINADHITVSGLLFQDGAFPRTACYSLNHAKGITIRECAMDWPEGSNFEKLKLGYNGLVANHAPDLTVERNLFLCTVTGVAAASSDGTVIRHNTFIGEGNYGVVIIPGSGEERYTIENNLFYRAIMGYKTGPCIWVFAPMPQLVSDYNLFYIPEEHKGTIGELPGTERLFPLKAWVEATGLDRNSMAAQPEFAAPEKLDFTLKAGSPGKGAASDGGDIGK